MYRNTLSHSLMFSIDNRRLPAYFIRSFIYLFVLLALVVHQFLYPAFIEPNLSVFGYSLCFFALFFDSLFLFFYREDQRKIDFFLFFLSALFLVSLNSLLGGGFLFFVFFLAFLQVFSLIIFGQAFLAFVFLLYLSFLFPIAFVWQGAGVFEDRLALSVLIHVVLFSIFIFSALFVLGLKMFEAKGAFTIASSSRKAESSSDTLLPLGFSKKLKPFLNSLSQSFSDQTDQKFLYQDLKKVQQFILDFIEFAELHKKSLSYETVDIKQILNESLEDLKAHEKRPDNLMIDKEGLDSFKIKGSSKHLKKCFENIVLNSFEALQNTEQPAIKIYCWRQKSWLFLQFLDNGQGIEEEDIDKLFEPLFSKRFGLRGLGLSYAKKAITLHAGEIKIERMAQWTKVLIKLPLRDSYYDNFKLFKILKNHKKAA